MIRFALMIVEDMKIEDLGSSFKSNVAFSTVVCLMVDHIFDDAMLVKIWVCHQVTILVMDVRAVWWDLIIMSASYMLFVLFGVLKSFYLAVAFVVLVPQDLGF